MTVKELIEKLQTLPEEAEVKRQMTVEYGTIEIENVRMENPNLVIID